MLVYHLIQVVKPGHLTSYKTGRNWMNSYKIEKEAQDRADLYNRHRSGDYLCDYFGVEYIVEGPVDEREEFK